MSDRPFVDEEDILVLTTRQPMPRWLRWLLQTLAVLAGIGLIVAAFIGWRYYSVQQRVKNDLAVFIAQEEEIRSLGGINAAPDLIIAHAPDAWRYRYLSSVRAHKDRPIPDLTLEKVDYDGVSARAYLRVNGVKQFREYRLQHGAWRRAPFTATGWGEKQVLPLPEGLEIIYWDEDAAFARALAEDLPQLLTVMQALGIALAAEGHRLVIIPTEFGDGVRPGSRVTGVIVNSPHVDLIPQEVGTLSPEQELRLALARKLLSDARNAAPATSHLPGAARVQAAIDEVMAWAWAVGGVSGAAVADWAAQLKGEWASPVTGLPPDLITKLPPSASDASARLMMAYLLRKEGVDALIALNEALATANAWDEAYGQAVGKTALQVEEAARTWARSPDGPPPDWPQTAVPAPPQTVIYLNAPSASSRWVLARTPAGRAIALRLADDVALTLADGSRLDFECIASGSTLHVTGSWIDAGLQMQVSDIVLAQAALPPIAQTPPLASEAWALAVRMPDAGPALLTALYPGGEVRTLAETIPIIAGPTSPPRLVWLQETRCSRPWIIAYRPDRGIVGAWLAPKSVTSIGDAVILNTAGDHLLLNLYKREGDMMGTYETGDAHVLAATSPERQQVLLTSLPAVRRFGIQAPAGPEAVDIVVAVDRATGQERTLYHAAADERIAFPVTLVGGPPDLLHFAVMRNESMAILAANPNKSDEIAPGVEIRDVAFILPVLARCPDRGYLYGAMRPGALPDETIGMLRVHREDGEDVLLLEEANVLFMPLYCVSTP